MNGKLSTEDIKFLVCLNASEESALPEMAAEITQRFEESVLSLVKEETCTLCRGGLVELWENPFGQSARILTIEEAVTVINSPTSWQRNTSESESESESGDFALAFSHLGLVKWESGELVRIPAERVRELMFFNLPGTVTRIL